MTDSQSLPPEANWAAHSSGEAALSCLILSHDTTHHQRCQQQGDQTYQVDQESASKILNSMAFHFQKCLDG